MNTSTVFETINTTLIIALVCLLLGMSVGMYYKRKFPFRYGDVSDTEIFISVMKQKIKRIKAMLLGKNPQMSVSEVMKDDAPTLTPEGISSMANFVLATIDLEDFIDTVSDILTEIHKISDKNKIPCEEIAKKLGESEYSFQGIIKAYEDDELEEYIISLMDEKPRSLDKIEEEYHRFFRDLHKVCRYMEIKDEQIEDLLKGEKFFKAFEAFKEDTLREYLKENIEKGGETKIPVLEDCSLLRTESIMKDVRKSCDAIDKIATSFKINDKKDGD